MLFQPDTAHLFLIVRYSECSAHDNKTRESAQATLQGSLVPLLQQGMIFQ